MKKWRFLAFGVIDADFMNVKEIMIIY